MNKVNLEFNLCLALKRTSDYSKERMAKLNKYVHKEIPSHENGYDSDDDM